MNKRELKTYVEILKSKTIIDNNKKRNMELEAYSKHVVKSIMDKYNIEISVKSDLPINDIIKVDGYSWNDYTLRKLLDVSNKSEFDSILYDSLERGVRWCDDKNYVAIDNRYNALRKKIIFEFNTILKNLSNLSGKDGVKYLADIGIVVDQPKLSDVTALTSVVDVDFIKNIMGNNPTEQDYEIVD